MEACTIRALKDVLVKVHDQVDRTRDFHVDVAFTEQQQMAVMRHDISIPGGSSAVVCVSPGVDIGFLHDRLRKLLSKAVAAYSTSTAMAGPIFTVPFVFLFSELSTLERQSQIRALVSRAIAPWVPNEA